MVLAAVAGTVALLLAIVLVTPFEVEVSAVKAADDPSVRVQTRARWFGFRLPLPDRNAGQASSKQKAGGRRGSIKWSTLKAVITSPGVPRRVVQLVNDEIRLTRPRRFHLHARLGFDDPSETGMFLGWTYALGGLRDSPAASIRIEPDFSGEVIAGELRVLWSRSLGAFIWPVVKFGLSPAVWRGFRAGWRAQRRP